jgi:integrase
MDAAGANMSKRLRMILKAHQEGVLLWALQLGRTSIADELVFPQEAVAPICLDDFGARYMERALEKAGLRMFRFHHLRHTFGSLPIRAGVPPAYI